LVLLWALGALSPADRSAADETPPAPPAAANLTPPTVSGAPEPGKVLTASPGTWTEDPSSYAYEWELCVEFVSGPPPAAPSGFSCTPIPGATAATYLVAQSDVGRAIRVKVTAFRGSPPGTPAYSAPTAAVGFHLIPRIIASAALSPRRLPRGRQAPAALRLGFSSTAQNPPGVPQLSAISFELSRSLSLHAAGIPSCPIKALYGTAAVAQRACAGAIVGRGTVDSEVPLEGEEVAVEGAMTAFYDLNEGQPHILGQVTTNGPLHLVYVLPFQIERERGGYGTRLAIFAMKLVHGRIIRGRYSYRFPYGYGRISRFELSLRRSFAFAGRRRSFVTASCPAPSGEPGTDFPLVRTTLTYRESEFPRQERPSGPASVQSGTVDASCQVGK
jgi:hypothetical protein